MAIRDPMLVTKASLRKKTQIMSIADRNAVADQLRRKTMDDLCINLDLYSKCAMIRPTGWGKTWAMVKLLGDYDKIVYVYPSQVIADTVNERISIEYSNNGMTEDDCVDSETIETVTQMMKSDSVKMITYQKLALSRNDDNALSEIADSDLIIFDEAHRMMAPGARCAIKQIIDTTTAHVVGVTASPVRTDGLDFVTEFFDGITTYSYTLHDAFMDGIFLIPYVCCFTTDMSVVEDDLKEQALTAGQSFQNMYIKEVLKSHIAQWTNMHDTETIVRETCDSCTDTEYMKFIGFFSDKNQLDAKSEEVIDWFHKAYPNHKIRTLVITSRQVEVHNTSKLPKMKREPMTIDLILTINMLNLGYHIDDLTGIIMYRGTTSDIVYIQQFGRCISTSMKHPCIIFDVVDNTHRKALWDLSPDGKQKSRKPKPHANTGTDKTENTEAKAGAYLSQTWRTYNQLRTASDVDKINAGGRVETHEGNKIVLLPDEYWSPITHEVAYKWWIDAGKICKTDLHMTGHMTEYAEDIAKLVGESLQKQCLIVFEIHMRRFCRDKGIPFPIAIETLKNTYGWEKQDIIDDLINIVKKSGTGYPIGDARKLLTCTTSCPLSLIAEWHNIGVRSVLETLGIYDPALDTDPQYATAI